MCLLGRKEGFEFCESDIDCCSVKSLKGKKGPWEILKRTKPLYNIARSSGWKSDNGLLLLLWPAAMEASNKNR